MGENKKMSIGENKGDGIWVRTHGKERGEQREWEREKIE